MRNFTESVTIAAEAVARMLQQYQEQPGMVAFLEGLLKPLQDAEHQAHLLMAAYSVSQAEGELLDWIGILHGQARPKTGNTSDEAYRVLIYARIAANVSVGTDEDLYNILTALQLRSARIFDFYPAAISVQYVNPGTALTCGCIRSILAAAKLQVAMDITQYEDGAFSFEGDEDGQGFDAGPIGENR